MSHATLGFLGVCVCCVIVWGNLIEIWFGRAIIPFRLPTVGLHRAVAATNPIMGWLCTEAAQRPFPLVKTMTVVSVNGAYVCELHHCVCSVCVCVCVSSGEWAKIGNLVYRVIDFPRCTGSGWLLILWDNDVTPDGAGCLLTHDNVRGALSPNAGQITHSLTPLSSLFPPPVFSLIPNAPVNPTSNHHRWAMPFIKAKYFFSPLCYYAFAF